MAIHSAINYNIEKNRGEVPSGLIGKIGTWFNNQLTGDLDYQRQQQLLQQQMNYNANQARIQRDYETEMANTAYQRAYNDIKAIGLNPSVLAGNGGAYTPQVASPSVNHSYHLQSGRGFNQLLGGVFGLFGHLVNSAISYKNALLKTAIDKKVNNVEKKMLYTLVNTPKNRIYDKSKKADFLSQKQLREMLSQIKVRKW